MPANSATPGGLPCRLASPVRQLVPLLVPCLTDLPASHDDAALGASSYRATRPNSATPGGATCRLAGPVIWVGCVGSHRLDALSPPAPAPSCATGRESGWR